ncbi:MAG: ASKHA domain-containing protein [Thermofilum sp.]|jgi:uncharacterized 2Fe-2S/4Fe-4S cluster protein (DUF4445 family)|nr:ASKHA domain-containing protein [Thermofilum sp.]
MPSDSFEKAIVCFDPHGRKVEVKRGLTLLDAANIAGVGVRSECGGRGTCGKCLVVVKDQRNLSPPSDSEVRLLSGDKLKAGYRLACQSIVRGDVAVLVPPESRLEARRILAEGLLRQFELDPAIRSVRVVLPKPSLLDTTPDFERLCNALKERGFGEVEMGHELMQRLPVILREANWDVEVVLWMDREIIALERGGEERGIYGASVDIGTSKLVLHLVDLRSGETVSVRVVENPQMVYGEDVVSRINYAALEEGGLRRLQGLVIEAINSLIEEACLEAGIERDRIYEVTVAGNTAMHHIFLGYPPKQLAVAPYVAVVRRSVNVKARQLGIKVYGLANVFVLPNIAGFVGADAVADVLATGIYESDDMSLLIDVGTNSEVFVGNREDIISCSTPAGSAFEGMHLEHGMKAVAGAIEKIRIDPEDYEVEYETIGGVKPVGMCGSAVVDAVAELFRCGLIDERGHFKRNVSTKRLRRENGVARFVVAWSGESATGRDITVSERDIQEILLAKAAIRAGVAVLMEERGVKEEGLDHLYIAGSFGRYLNPESALFIGLIPDIPLDRISFVGNTAIAGAKMCLLSRSMRRVADELSNKIRYVELTAHPGFRREFTNALFIPHRDLSRYPTVMKHISRVSARAPS